MPSKLVRITVDLHDPYVKVLEYGQFIEGSLTTEQREELEELEDTLNGFSDFASATDINDEERKELMEKKMRVEELKMLEEDRIQWIEQDVTLLQSVLLMMTPDWAPIYSENIPRELLIKMLDPNLTVNIMPGTIVAGAAEEEVKEVPASHPAPQPPQQPQSQQSDNVLLVEEIIRGIKESPTMSANQGKPWVATKVADGFNGLVYVSEESPQGQSSLAGVVYAWPVKYLKDDWGPVNTALKEKFGDSKLNWVRTDPGKYSHWTVKF